MYLGKYTPKSAGEIELFTFMQVNFPHLIETVGFGPKIVSLCKGSVMSALEEIGCRGVINYFPPIDTLVINLEELSSETILSSFNGRSEVARLWAIMVNAVRLVLFTKGNLRNEHFINPAQMSQLGWKADVLQRLGSHDETAAPAHFDEMIVQVVTAGYLETTTDSDSKIEQTLKQIVLSAGTQLPAVFRLEMGIIS